MNIFQKIGYWVIGAKTVSTITSTWEAGKPQYPETKFENLVKFGWRKNELIFACIAKKAGTASQVRLKVYSKSTEEPVPNHPLQTMIRNPNPFMSEYDFWSSVFIYQDLAGRAAYEKERNRAGKTIHLWPLRPDWLHPIPSQTQFISGYEYEVPGVGSKVLPAEDVLDMRLFDPINQYNSWPPVAVAGRIGDVDNSATDFIKIFFEKGGIPPGVIKTTKRLRDTEVTEIRRKWGERYGGIQGWLEPAVLDQDASYEPTGSTFEQMGFEILDARNEARICAVLQVPPIIVGAKVGLDRSTMANYKEARTSWWEDDLVPTYMNHMDSLENLAAEYPDIYLGWDFSQVPALREERVTLWSRANEGLKMGGITVNEYRNELGYKPLGETGDVFLRPMNLQTVDLEGNVISEPPPLNQPADGTALTDELTPNQAALIAKYSLKSGLPWYEVERVKREKHLAKRLEAYFGDIAAEAISKAEESRNA